MKKCFEVKHTGACIYFLSDDVKEGDYAYTFYSEKDIEVCKKIIAVVPEHTDHKGNPVPQIPESYTYKGEDEIWLECESLCTETGLPCGMPCFNESICYNRMLLKLTDNNEVIITDAPVTDHHVLDVLDPLTTRDQPMNENELDLRDQFALSLDSSIESRTKDVLAVLGIGIEDIDTTEKLYKSNMKYQAKIRYMYADAMMEARKVKETTEGI